MNEKQIKKVNDLIEKIMSGQKQVRNKELILNHLYKRLEQLETL